MPRDEHLPELVDQLEAVLPLWDAPPAPDDGPRPEEA